MKLLLRIGLFLAILSAFVYLLSMIPRDWLPLLINGLVLVLFIACFLLLRENRRLKNQIRELEMGLGL